MYNIVPLLLYFICISVLLRMMADVPVEEDTLMWLLLMGLGYDHRLGANEAVDLADQLIRRAAMLAANGQCLSCIFQCWSLEK